MYIKVNENLQIIEMSDNEIDNYDIELQITLEEFRLKAHKIEIVNDELVCTLTDAPVPPEFSSLAQIDEAVVSKIREIYSIDNEFKMQRIGILDSTNEEFIAYCVYVEECRLWGQAKKLELEG